jgi:hypothetical protein
MAGIKSRSGGFVEEGKFGVKIPGGWFHEATHLYRNEKGTIVPSSTQVFEILGLYDFSAVSPERMAWKSAYGSAIHKAVEYMVAGDLDWEELDPAICDPVSGIERRFKEMAFVSDACEERRIASIFGMSYGSTLDHRGTVMHRGQRRHAVLDLKSGTKFSKCWEWQIGSYIWPQEKVPLGWLGIALQVDTDGSVTPHYVSDVEAAKREFQVLLAAAILKINNGFAKIGRAI